MPFKQSGGTVRITIAMFKTCVDSLRLLASKHSHGLRVNAELVRDMAITDLARAIMRSIEAARFDPHYDVTAMMVPMAMDVVKLKAAKPLEWLDVADVTALANNVETCRLVIVNRFEKRKKDAAKRRAALKKEKANVTDG